MKNFQIGEVQNAFSDEIRSDIANPSDLPKFRRNIYDFGLYPLLILYECVIIIHLTYSVISSKCFNSDGTINFVLIKLEENSKFEQSSNLFSENESERGKEKDN